MRHRLPSLNALRAFDAAGRCLSLTAAAEEMGVSVASVSRHIAILEGHFGFPLLVRHRSGVSLSEIGQRFHVDVSAAFNILIAASRDLANKDDIIRVRCYSTLATEWLLPRLSSFRAQHPEVDLQLELSLPETDGPIGDRDLVITAVPPPGDGISSGRLFESIMTPVCAREMTGLSPTSQPEQPTFLFARREGVFWAAILQALKLPPIENARRVQFDTLSLTYQAARGGGGLALGNLFFLMHDLRAGRLVAPFNHAFRFPVNHYWVSPRERLRHGPTERFRQWLVVEATDTNREVDAFLAARGPGYVVDLPTSGSMHDRRGQACGHSSVPS
jgi:LysR family glycine cleavage system transcriptional activator